MKKSILTTIVLSFIGYASFASFAFVPGDTAKATDVTKTQKIKINAAAVLDVDFSGTDVTFDYTTAEDYEDTLNVGKTQTQKGEFKIKSTKPWSLSVEPGKVLGVTPTHFKSTSSANATEVPVSALSIRKYNAANIDNTGFTGISAFSATGTKGGKGVATNKFEIDYNLKPGGYFAQDDYSLELVFTISQD